MIPAPLIAAALSAAAVFWLAWTLQGVRLDRVIAEFDSREQDYQLEFERSQRKAAEIRARLEIKTEGAINERDAEIERLRELAGRIPDVVRVRIPGACPMPAGAGDPAGATGDRGSAAGVLPDGVGGDSGGVVALDVRRVTALMERAEQLAADARMVQSAGAR